VSLTIHNHEVTGSSPVLATLIIRELKSSNLLTPFFLPDFRTKSIFWPDYHP